MFWNPSYHRSSSEPWPDTRPCDCHWSYCDKIFPSFLFIGEVFKSHTEWTNARISPPPTTVLLFVFRPTNRMSMAQGFFMVGPGAGPQLTRARHFEKYLRPCRHSPKEGCLRRQAINLTPPKKVKAWGTAPWGQRDLQCRGTPDLNHAVDTTTGRSVTQQLERHTKHVGLVDKPTTDHRC